MGSAGPCPGPPAAIEYSHHPGAYCGPKAELGRGEINYSQCVSGTENSKSGEMRCSLLLRSKPSTGYIGYK